jgi:small subunit ribosomal protein S3
LKEKLKMASVSKIAIERAGKYIRINIYTSRPGIVIGKGGQGMESIRVEVEQMTQRKTFVNVMEIKKPETDAQLCADNIAYQIEKLVAFRRAMKKVIQKAMAAGAGGIKVMCSGRLGGAEIARTEWLKEGRVPLQTFRAEIDYGFSEANTTMGKIGIKVWIFKKEHFQKTAKELLEEAKLVENVEEVGNAQEQK